MSNLLETIISNPFMVQMDDLCICTHLVNVSQLAVDVLAELEQQADGTLVEDVQAEEQRQKSLAER